MAKWIKVQVPDDFDTIPSDDNHDRIVIKRNPNAGEFGSIIETENAKIWNPVYRQVLDYGFVGLIDFMGDDNTVVQAARVSYGGGTKRSRTDEGLLRYLYSHRHTTPFEMCEFMYHVKAPIFVFRQWHRHRTASINEMSARYSVLDNEMYMPSFIDTKPQASDNKQGRSNDLLTDGEYEAIIAALNSIYDQSYTTYEYFLGPIPVLDENGKPIKDKDGNPLVRRSNPPDEIQKRKLWLQDATMQALRQARREEEEWFRLNPDGVRERTDWDSTEMIESKIKEFYAANEFSVLDDDFPGLARELARMVLPVATYSQMYWKTDLKNLLHFIGLRSDPHAQKEIRVYSDAMLELITPIVPWSVNAFIDYHLNGTNISRMELEALRSYLDSDSSESFSSFMTVKMKELGCSGREITEFLKKFE